MNIIIIGAGRIGKSLAKSLSDENNEVYLIEQNESIARSMSEKLDVKIILGNGADPETLEKANVKNADLVLAVTTSDETNLVVCSLASSFGAKRKIARVRNTALNKTLAVSGFKMFGISEVINPELLAAETIVKIIQTPGASEVADFANGKILLRVFDIVKESPMCGHMLEEFKDDDFPWPFIVIAVTRDNEVIFPKGDTSLQEGDLIYVLLPSHSLGEFLTFVDPNAKMPEKIIIYGASITGRHVARALSGKIKNLILLEEDENLATEIAGELEDVTIINGSASEADILNEAGIEVADAFIATSENDHSNLISSVLAKKMGAKETIIITQHPDYMTIIDSLDIDAIINPHHLAVEQIIRLVRGKCVSAVAKLLDVDAEALEFVPEEGSAVTKNCIKNINFPKKSIIGAIDNGDEVILANGDTQILAGQQVVVFCHQSVIKKVQSLFICN